MNRRSFLTTVIAGIFAAPALALLRKPKPYTRDQLMNTPFTGIGVDRDAIRRPGMRRITSIPPEAGKVNSLAEFKGHLFVACENGLWTMPLDP